jgi:hypothetical protein
MGLATILEKHIDRVGIPPYSYYVTRNSDPALLVLASLAEGDKLHPYSPKREMVAGAGLFVGLLAAVMFGIWRYYRTPLPAVAAQ